MRKLFLFYSVVALVSCNNADTVKTSKDSTSAASQEVSYAYPIMYSSKFEMGDPGKAQKISEFWKDFDNNSLNNQKDAFADTVRMVLPGIEMYGTRDSLLAITQSSRNDYSSVKSSIDAIMSTKSIDTDKDGNWVSVWGSEITTTKNGKIDSSKLHEVWHFNKNGKIDYISQFRQDYPTAKR